MSELNENKVVVVTGFQGVNNGSITTLGRGGSDTSAVALAAALNAQECLIFTDVDGVYTTDPRIVPEANRLTQITFEEMLEMASLGSKILQIRSVEFAGKYKVRTRVLSSLTHYDIPITDESVSGTLITQEEDKKMENAVISGIAFNRDEAKITITGVPDTPGVAFRILGPIAKANIDVDMIIQNSSNDGSTDFSFTVNRNDLDEAIGVIETKVKSEINALDISSDNQICKVSVVGIGMRSHVGVASQMFEVLSNEGINIKMISTSEIKISVVIDDKYMELAVRSLHNAFGLDKK
jgi:aspartate kinase